MGRDKEILTAKYGASTINGLHEAVKGYMTLESIIANKPDVVVAGWDYGFSEANNLTPDTLHGKGINSYLLTESCRQKDGQNARGVMDPWNAVRTDITNLATLTGHEATKNLDAVKKKRYLNLPYAMWTSGPLNIDAAEHLRVSLEKWGLEPQSSIKPQLKIPASVPGHEG